MHTKELENNGMKNLKVEELMAIEGGDINKIAESFRDFFIGIFNKKNETEVK